MGAIYVSMTVDWEGEHFDNVGDLADMRNGIEKALGGSIPFTHYICPTYWLNESKLKNPRKQVAKALATYDEIALHVHCRRELIDAASLPFLDNKETNLGDSSGHGIPLGVYSQPQIEKILRKAREILSDNLTNGDIPGFRCGAWMASDGVLKALMACGFVYDASGLPPAIFSQGFMRGNEGNYKDTTGDDNLLFTRTIIRLWGYVPHSDSHVSNGLSLRWNAGQAITPTTGPFKIFDASRSIIEMPNNAGLCDYANEEFMGKTLEALIDASDGSSEPLFLNLGCHQEGDSDYKERLVTFFTDKASTLKNLASSGKLHFSTVLEASRAADLYMVD